jgi:hypothetical protein
LFSSFISLFVVYFELILEGDGGRGKEERRKGEGREKGEWGNGGMGEGEGEHSIEHLNELILNLTQTETLDTTRTQNKYDPFLPIKLWVDRDIWPLFGISLNFGIFYAVYVLFGLVCVKVYGLSPLVAGILSSVFGVGCLIGSQIGGMTLWNSIFFLLFCCFVLFCVVLCCFVLFCVVLCCFVLFCVVLCCGCNIILLLFSL